MTATKFKLFWLVGSRSKIHWYCSLKHSLLRSATIFNVENQKYVTNAIVTKFADIFYDVCWVAGFAIVKNETNAQRVKLNNFFNVLVSVPLFFTNHFMILWTQQIFPNWKKNLVYSFRHGTSSKSPPTLLWSPWIMVHRKWMANVGSWMFYHFISIYG